MGANAAAPRSNEPPLFSDFAMGPLLGKAREVPAEVSTALTKLFGTAACEVRLVEYSLFARLHFGAVATTPKSIVRVVAARPVPSTALPTVEIIRGDKRALESVREE